VTLVLVLTFAVIATPPTIARLFGDEVRADSQCQKLMPASANEYVIKKQRGSYTCTYRRNGKVVSIVNVSG
jgi:hypothetical protein